MTFDLSDEEWALVESLMPNSRKGARVDDRKILNAIFFVLGTGEPWRNLPRQYGPYTTAYNRFNRWSRRGVWKRLLERLPLKVHVNLYPLASTLVSARRSPHSAKRARTIWLPLPAMPNGSPPRHPQ